MINSRAGQDRRRFFRIDDRLLLSVRRLTAEDAADAAAGAADVRASGVLADLDRRIATIINAARLQAPAVAELAELLNSKLDHVVAMLGLGEELAQRAQFHEQQVNISASGLGFETDELFESDELLQVEIMFPPSNARLTLRARVVRCIAGEQGGANLLQMEFADLGNDDQEFLIQYIVRRQGQVLQQLREARDVRLPPRPVAES
jgi:hypothetical protein